MENDLIDVKELISNLDSKMWKTRGCRYNSDRRLKRKSSLSLTAISFLSSYVLIVSIIPYFGIVKLSATQNDYFPLVSVVLSIFILVLSLLEASKEHSLKAERLYTCANKVNNLMSDLKFAQVNITDENKLKEKVESINVLYHSVIDSYQENHNDLDFSLFKLENRAREVKINKIESKVTGEFQFDYLDLIKLIYQLTAQYSLYLLCILAPPVILYICFF